MIVLPNRSAPTTLFRICLPKYNSLLSECDLGYVAVYRNHTVRCRGAGRVKRRIVITVMFQMDRVNFQVCYNACKELHCFCSICHGLVTATWPIELANTTYMLRRDCWPLSSSLITVRGSMSLECEPKIATPQPKRISTARSLGWDGQKRRPRTLSRVETLVPDPLK